MKVNILGTEYTIKECKVDEDNYLNDCDGYCDKSSKTIVVCDRRENSELSDWEWYKKKVMRHEIIHAFLFESGLAENWEHSYKFGHDETVVDWIAMQFPKILEVYRKVGCL